MRQCRGATTPKTHKLSHCSPGATDVQTVAWEEGDVGLPGWNTINQKDFVKTTGTAEKYQHLELTGKL